MTLALKLKNIIYKKAKYVKYGVLGYVYAQNVYGAGGHMKMLCYIAVKRNISYLKLKLSSTGFKKEGLVLTIKNTGGN